METHYFVREDMDAPRVLAVPGGEVCVFSRRCPGKETPNEDAAGVFLLGEDAIVLVVADGAGGLRGGELASDMALKEFAAELEAVVTDGGPVRNAVLNGIEAANRAVCDLAIGAATTLAAVEIEGGRARTYHVGDSGVLVTGQRGKLKHSTTAHSPTGYAVEAGVLDEEQALHHEERHLVSNVIGAPDMHIELGPALVLSPRDTVLVASDGLLDNLRTEELVEFARRGPLARAARSLAQRASERMEHDGGEAPSKPDDLTLLLYRPKTRRPSGGRIR